MHRFLNVHATFLLCSKLRRLFLIENICYFFVTFVLCCVQILIALEVLEVRFVEVFVDRHAFEILIKKVAFAR